MNLVERIELLEAKANDLNEARLELLQRVKLANGTQEDVLALLDTVGCVETVAWQKEADSKAKELAAVLRDLRGVREEHTRQLDAARAAQKATHTTTHRQAVRELVALMVKLAPVIRKEAEAREAVAKLEGKCIGSLAVMVPACAGWLNTADFNSGLVSYIKEALRHGILDGTEDYLNSVKPKG